MKIEGFPYAVEAWERGGEWSGNVFSTMEEAQVAAHFAMLTANVILVWDTRNGTILRREGPHQGGRNYNR